MAERRLRGRMSDQFSSMKARQSWRFASFSAIRHPAGTASEAGHSEYYSSSLSSTR